uniref:U6 snRNA phosphodiesterase 1 n=1 Tax=Theileria annulata TaxID=5874 RepID=A0A3B0N0W7_THEAN
MIDHNSNVRNVPHVDGNYHTLCYIKVEISKEISSIAKKAYNTLFNLEKLNNVLFSEQPTQADSDYTHSDIDMDLDSQTNSTRLSPSYAHLSLCKPLYLRRQFIDSFLEKLKNTLQNLKPFYLILENRVSICANENLNRYFAVSFVDKACRDDTVLPIIDRVDQVVESFGFEKYYEQRKPHVSFASTRDLSLALSELYKSTDPSEGSHSSNYWTNIDYFLEKCDNLPQEAINYYDATSVNYTFTFQGSDLEDTAMNNEDKICLYVDEIHVLVGSRDHVIKLV